MNVQYKNIPVNTPAYRRVMMFVGDCIKSGGAVSYDHKQVIDIDRYGVINTKNTIDVTISD